MEMFLPPTLVVWKLDRLGRSVKNLIDLVGNLQKRNIQFKSLTDSIDTGTTSGRFFFHVMASLAEMERELTIEHTRAGLEIARQLGRKGGRKPKNRQQDRVSKETTGQRHSSKRCI
jgi:DNA invertase Pin-like site-specific DNA recombinase